MARPKHEQPTPAELAILHALWDAGPLTVRGVMEILNGDGRQRAYTTVMTLMNVMVEKGLLKRMPQGKAFLYAPTAERQQTLGTLLGDLLSRAFSGSPSALVAQLLDQANPSEEELREIRKAINDYKKQQGAS